MVLLGWPDVLSHMFQFAIQRSALESKAGISSQCWLREDGGPSSLPALGRLTGSDFNQPQLVTTSSQLWTSSGVEPTVLYYSLRHTLHPPLMLITNRIIDTNYRSFLQLSDYIWVPSYSISHSLSSQAHSQCRIIFHSTMYNGQVKNQPSSKKYGQYSFKIVLLLAYTF